MKKKYIFIVFLLILCSLSSNQAFASRTYAPEIIPPVIYKQMKIVADNNSSENMGIVQAFNKNTNKIIWSRRVYTVKINPNVEKDTQEVYIKEMKIENNKLVVINENSEKYILDPNTGKEINNNKLILAIIIMLSVMLILGIFIIRHSKRKERNKALQRNSKE